MVVNEPATIASNLTGSSGLIKDGDATLSLTGTNTYTGPTSVIAGKLQIKGSVGGEVTVQANAILGPGASIGTLTVPSAAINGSLAIEIDGSAADRLNVTGNLNITDATLAITGAPIAPELIIASFGSLTGSAFATVVGLPSGYGVIYDLTNKQIKLSALSTGFVGWIGPFGVSNPAADADPDFDGIPNALEYVLGGDPSRATSNIAPIRHHQRRQPGFHLPTRRCRGNGGHQSLRRSGRRSCHLAGNLSNQPRRAVGRCFHRGKRSGTRHHHRHHPAWSRHRQVRPPQGAGSPVIFQSLAS